MALVSFLLTSFIAVALAGLPFFKIADPPPDHAKRRVSTIDGLRGYLALAVAVHHDTMYAEMLRTGEWHMFGRSSVMLGEGGVSMFFMVTGYLFWRRLVLARGRIGWKRLYINRIFRIGPLYIVAAILALAVTTPQLPEPAFSGLDIALQTLRWLALGIFGYVEVNGARPWIVLVGVVWSLSWEWGFYASLPLLSLFSRWRWSHLATAVLITAGAGTALVLADRLSIEPTYAAWTMLFGVGMLTASLQINGAVLKLGDRWTSCLAAGLIVLALESFQDGYRFWPISVLGMIFYFVATGTSLFGLLRLRVSHRLGHISYGIYLLQGLVITPLFILAAPAVTGSRAAEFAVTGLVALLLVPLALLAHRWIELPGIWLGDRVVAWIGQERRGHGLSALDRKG